MEKSGEDSQEVSTSKSEKLSPKFAVWYLGSKTMDRLYSQTMQPWVMAEIRRKRENIQEVVIEVAGEVLRVNSTDENQEGKPPLFEHHLRGLTRFAKLHQDPRCFAYLTRYQLNDDFQCHVYLANAEEMIPQLFKAIREASKDVHSKPGAGQSQTGDGAGDTAAQSTAATATDSTSSGSSNSSAATPTSSLGEGGDAGDQSTSLFEVKYLGRAKVGSKRVTADYIDGLAEKMIAREEDLMMKRLEEIEEDKHKNEQADEERKRHASGASVKSLPDTLDDVAADLTTENKLEVQKEMLKKGQKPLEPANGTGSCQIPAAVLSSEAGSDSSMENVADSKAAAVQKLGVGIESQGSNPISLQVDFPSDSDSSRDNLASSEEYVAGPADQSQPTSKLPVTAMTSPLVDYLNRRRHSSQKEEGWGIRSSQQDQVTERLRRASGDSLDNVGSICRQQEASRIMVLQIGEQDLSLISLDKKVTILECKFKDISFVSQGSRKQDLFGIVARESGTSFICYILKCLTDSVVCEIMSTLQMAFTAAYSKKEAQSSSNSNSGASGGTVAATGATTTQHQVCTMCPLHQLHRVCQEINVLCPQAAHDFLIKKVHLLPDKDLAEINHRMQVESPESFVESVEVIMICLHQLCERKQKEHIHLSEGNKTAKGDMNLLEEKHTLFEGLRNKARKSLTTSFENLLSRGKKKEDVREVKQRSWTDSEASWASHDSSTTSTPDASPMPSPMSKEFHHEFPSPPGSPAPLRQRSATLDSPGSDRHIARVRDVNHNNKTTSPMKTMFLLATNSPQQSESLSSSVVSSPLEDPTLLASPRRPSSSWRKAIFNRVCTPQHSIDFGDDGHHSDGSQGKLHNTSEIRAMWKKAILETLLLIRMEKENHTIRARQEEGGVPLSRKLEYQELTPCLKEITSVWEKILSLHVEEEEEGAVGEGAVEVGVTEEKTIPNAKLLEYVKKGVPRTLRGQIWLFLMQQKQMSSTVPDSTCNSLNYEDLLKQLTTHQHAILIDLGRTFPCHPYFSKALGPGQLELFNLLKAYSLLDPEVGYCQGLSFIVGMLLMHMEEISAFHVLKYIMYDLGLRKQFRPNMMALQIKLYQLTRLLHDHYRDVYEHFETHEISPTLYAAPWFLTVFASQFPLGFVARVFDMIFVQGIDALFKVALMLISNHRALILQCDSFETIVDFLKTTLPEMVQIQMERIINQAFELDITKELQAYEVEYHVLSEEMTYSPPQHHQQQHHPHHHRTHHTQHRPYHHGKTHSPSAGKTHSTSAGKTHSPSAGKPHSPSASKAHSPPAAKSHSPSAGKSTNFASTAAERPSRLVERRRSSIDIEMIYRVEQQNRALKNQNMELLEKLQHAQSQQRSFEVSVHTHQIELDKLKSHIRTLELERAALLSTVATLRKLVPPEELQKVNSTLALPGSPQESTATSISQLSAAVASDAVICTNPLNVTSDMGKVMPASSTRPDNQPAHIPDSGVGLEAPSQIVGSNFVPTVSSASASQGQTSANSGSPLAGALSESSQLPTGNTEVRTSTPVLTGDGKSQVHKKVLGKVARTLSYDSASDAKVVNDTQSSGRTSNKNNTPVDSETLVNSAPATTSAGLSTKISSTSLPSISTMNTTNLKSSEELMRSSTPPGDCVSGAAASHASLSTSSAAATTSGVKQSYTPRSIYSAGNDIPTAADQASVEERRKQAKVRVQLSPTKSPSEKPNAES